MEQTPMQKLRSALIDDLHDLDNGDYKMAIISVIEYIDEEDLIDTAEKDYIKKKCTNFLNWFTTLKPHEKVSVWSRDGQSDALRSLDNDEIVSKFFKSDD